MTAEVVVMNKSAVALASDSAVTCSPTQKVFNSAEKLFMLIPGRPIGLLIYNNSEFMQMPWETIIKKYRNYIDNKSYDTLQEYTDDFLSFLSNPNSGLYSEEQYDNTFNLITRYYLREIVKSILETIKNRIEDKAKRISRKEISEIISLWISQYKVGWENFENQYSDDEIKIVKRDLLKYQRILDSAIDSYFGRVQLSNDDKTKIEQFCYSLFYKKKITDFHTGLVIAGFGESELYPVCVEYIVENYFCNHLKYFMKQEAKIDPNTTGWIIAFAQDDIVKNFLNGIHPDFEERLESELSEVFSPESMIEITKAMKGLSKKRKQAIINALEKLKKDKHDNMIQKVQVDFREEHTDSVLLTVSFLPKDELANMAESLVNITSFMRRVSMDVESVGGPIDVAVISKKDGFIWIKRKHYFDPIFNPHYKSYSIGEII